MHKESAGAGTACPTRKHHHRKQRILPPYLPFLKSWTPGNCHLCSCSPRSDNFCHFCWSCAQKHSLGWKPAVCTHRSDDRLHPVVHQKECGQQAEGGDALLCSHSTPPGSALHRQDTSPLKTSWDSWGCSTWRRKGPRETSSNLQVF